MLNVPRYYSARDGTIYIVVSPIDKKVLAVERKKRKAKGWKKIHHWSFPEKDSNSFLD